MDMPCSNDDHVTSCSSQYMNFPWFFFFFWRGFGYYMHSARDWQEFIQW